mmetsp:Transcript_7036/g.8472  ORF Transcript_7036/g.8472 Transcript_7036/m.8472 type:complete len:95 (-) Transcript_7036:62-346(-)
MVILFWANWYAECDELRTTLETISQHLQHILICWVDVISEKEIVEKYEVYVVPYILLMHPENDYIEYIKAPKKDSLPKIVGAYEEYYRLKKVSE